MEYKNKRNTPAMRAKRVRSQKDMLYQIGAFVLLIVIWEIAARRIAIPLIWPSAFTIGESMVRAVTDPTILSNFGITLARVLKGWGIAVIFGVPVGLAMGLSRPFNAMFGGIINALRQIPMMAWVPLTIIWFGIGDGPTLFMIALNGIFQVVLNTASGVQGVSRDYFHAAKSMGAGKASVFFNVTLPGSLPDILTGARLAIGGGWMSVI